MPKAFINTFKSGQPEGSTEMHYGYVCTVAQDGRLVADIPEELIAIEVEAGRVEIITEKGGAKALEDMKAGELVAYATENGLDIGGLVAQAGKGKILAAVLEAIAKKG